MQQPMMQFLAKLGFITLILSAERLFIFSIGCEMEGIFAWIYHNLSILFFKEMDTYSSNGYQLVLLQLYLINTVMLDGLSLNIIWKSSKNTYMLFFEHKIMKIDDSHMKAANFKGLSWLK